MPTLRGGIPMEPLSNYGKKMMLAHERRKRSLCRGSAMVLDFNEPVLRAVRHENSPSLPDMRRQQAPPAPGEGFCV